MQTLKSDKNHNLFCDADKTVGDRLLLVNEPEEWPLFYQLKDSAVDSVGDCGYTSNTFNLLTKYYLTNKKWFLSFN